MRTVLLLAAVLCGLCVVTPESAKAQCCYRSYYSCYPSYVVYDYSCGPCYPYYPPCWHAQGSYGTGVTPKEDYTLTNVEGVGIVLIFKRTGRAWRHVPNANTSKGEKEWVEFSIPDYVKP